MVQVVHAGENQQASRLITFGEHTERSCPCLLAFGVEDEPLVPDRGKAHIQPTVQVCTASCQQDRLLQGGQEEGEVNTPSL
jgi:hypothetical protein